MHCLQRNISEVAAGNHFGCGIGIKVTGLSNVKIITPVSCRTRYSGEDHISGGEGVTEYKIIYNINAFFVTIIKILPERDLTLIYIVVKYICIAHKQFRAVIVRAGIEVGGIKVVSGKNEILSIAKLKLARCGGRPARKIVLINIHIIILFNINYVIALNIF